jgi:hypothetical protein
VDDFWDGAATDAPYHIPAVMTAEATSHSFLVRLWIEGVDPVARSIRWRGHVTHLIDEERRHVESFEHLNEFIEGYLVRSAGPGFSRADRPSGDG